MKKFKVLQIGCGGISNAWISCFLKRDDVDICGLVDLNAETAKAIKEKYKLECEVYTDMNKAIKSLAPDIAVDNTIPEAHVDVVITALENG